MKALFVVKYSGPFGFIKPWTAVRDRETFSQQFLTPSIVEGMEKKLFPELLNENKYDKGGIYKIKRHRVSYRQISQQQEQIQPRGWNRKGTKKNPKYERPYAILTRGVLLNPELCLAFGASEDAERAAQQHLCLCRNEDILYPEEVVKVYENEFDENEEIFSGFELLFEEGEQSFLVGYNRFAGGKPMYGRLKTLGNPVRAL
jgi:hypothetical protein